MAFLILTSATYCVSSRLHIVHLTMFQTAFSTLSRIIDMHVLKSDQGIAGDG